jgi:hypothetical protein
MALPGNSHDMASDIYGDVVSRCKNLMVLREEPTQPANTFQIDAEAAKQQARLLSSAIFAARDKLLHILDCREAHLRKRWVKKSSKQRKKILQDAWPNIPIRHRPDIQRVLESIYSTKEQPISTRLEDDAGYKWPHLSVEDLVHGQALLLLLNSRGRNHPGVFAHADLASCEIGLLNGSIETAWCPDAWLMLVGQGAPETYGAFVHRATHQHAFPRCGRDHIFGVREGLLVLEIQQKLYEFLLECCCKMFSDATMDEILRRELPQQPEPAKIETTDASYVTLASVVAEAPFRVPATLDSGKLL